MICFICHNTPDVEHEHHVTPQAAGGKDLGTIVLCPECHGYAHKEMNRICAAYRKGKGGAASVNWKQSRHSQEVQNATFVVMHGVKSILTFDGDKTVKTSIALPPEVHQIVMALKQKTGVSSIPEVIINCILYTARHSKLV